MAALTVGGVTVPVGLEGHSQGREDLGDMTRSGAGYLRSNVTATRGRAKVWFFETRWLTASEAATVLGALDTIGRVTAAGDHIGSSTSVYVRSLEAEERAPGLTRYTFQLHAAEAD